MEEYLDAHAPQWVDFTKSCSPQVAQDFFDRVRTIEPKDKLCDFTSKDTENIQPASQEDVSDSNTIMELQEDLIMKNTPVKVVSPNCDNKEKITITYDQILNNAMRTLEFCQKPPKIRDVSNKINQESNVFKTPSVSKGTKSSRSIGFRSVPNKHVQSSQDTVSKSVKINKNNNTVNMRRTLANHYLFKQDDACAKNNTSKIPDVCSDATKDKKKDKEPKEDSEELKDKELDKDSGELKEENKELNEENKEEHEKENNDEFKNDSGDHNEEKNEAQQDEQEESIDDNKDKEENNEDDVDTAIEKAKQRQSNKHTSILTWQNHRRSMYKRRTSTNSKQYVSLAEAVSRFQNETPKRFRTRSTKENNTSAVISLPKLMQNRLRTTVPISPALVSKNRARAVTVLSQEEREKLQLEEMKKYQIKAKPIPPSVLRGPRVMPKVAKKSADTTQSESGEISCATSLLQSKNSPPPACHDKTFFGPKKTVPRITVTDSEGIIVEQQTIAFFGVPKESVTKSATRVQPFSFEARNKNLQMKKEQRLKSLQEVNKTKEFHARPVPNFSKPPTPSAKQQQQQQQQRQSMKRSVLPCPFSFEERNKQLSKKKEQLVKQVLEEDKRSRIFRANPAPSFKPVMVRGRSKDRLFVQDKKVANEHEDQENLEPNVGSSKTENKSTRKTKSAACAIDKQKASLKEKIHPPELNTDKRAKERREFEERLKRREMEDEKKRQEQIRKELEEEMQVKVELRKLTEVKARPMPKYKLPIIVKATKQLTQPQSPAFASKLKSKQT
ncbi:targeting protein for Xklp2 [Linepithema humile]|uniref:targeting protein for Xklp2 n=1 Tax=Linepithema humile TaxID=83485 RepID=UPI00351EC606